MNWKSECKYQVNICLRFYIKDTNLLMLSIKLCVHKVSELVRILAPLVNGSDIYMRLLFVVTVPYVTMLHLQL